MNKMLNGKCSTKRLNIITLQELGGWKLGWKPLSPNVNCDNADLQKPVIHSASSLTDVTGLSSGQVVHNIKLSDFVSSFVLYIFIKMP